MSSGRGPKIYRRRRPLRAAGKVLGLVLALAVLLFAILFFALQKHIVYTPDGLRLDIQWLAPYRDAGGSET